MKLRAIMPKDYGLIIESDKKVYPTSNPVTLEVIKQWYSKNPEFGMIYENRGIEGTCIAIPLNSLGWNKLINGKLAESEMDEKTIFDNSRDKEMGIHIYHIEKLNPKIKEFYKTALKDLSSMINRLRKTNKELEVIGFSALAVTISGINLFEKKFNCKERKYICSENVLEKNNKLIVVDTKSENIENKLKEGYKFVTKCKMLVLFPSEKSVVWKYFEKRL